ncbi:hypothetical protein, partial [Ralstonia pseudosolanacearum]
MPCYTCRDAFTSGSLRPSQSARIRLRGALIISGSPSRRRAAPQYAARRFQSGSRASSRFTQLEPLTQLDMERGKPYRAGHVEKKNQQGIVG